MIIINHCVINFYISEFFIKENIEVDITNLELNGNIRVEDVKEKNLEILNSPRIPIASVVLTRQLKQEEATAAKDEKKK